MNLGPANFWKLDFARSADDAAYRDILLRVREEERRQEQVRQKNKKDKDEQHKDREENESEFAVMALATEITEFQVTLDHYDEATYEALIENEELLIDVRKDIESMLDRAVVLPDGRRVFESEDGIRVFDEHGVELDASVVTPEDVDDARPKWEAFRDAREAERALVEERTQIIDYQSEIAKARQAAEDGKMTAQELKTFEAKLAEDMPDRVAEHLPPELRPAQELAQPEVNALKQDQAFRQNINLSMPAL